MNIIKHETKFCVACMKEHDVATVEVSDFNIFKGKEVEYTAVYDYCDKTDSYFSTEEQITSNDISMKNAYRKSIGLLTSDEISAIRKKYGISQSDLALLLGWGAKTITRYESHQVQDHAHDTILRKLAEDPEWFCELLGKAKESFSESTYAKYQATATQLFENAQDMYLCKSIAAQYAKFDGDVECCGASKLNINKIKDVIRYFSNAERVVQLFKVKLMKMLWYADSLAFKRRGHSITGLAYVAMPMGAVPIGHRLITDLQGINCVELDSSDPNGYTSYRFLPTADKTYPNLSEGEIQILEDIISAFGSYSKREIVERMHKEDAFIETAQHDIIQYKYAKRLSLS